MPFITEEIYHILKDRKDDIIVADYPVSIKSNESHLKQGEMAKDIIVKIRDVRAKNNISPKETLSLLLQVISNTLKK